MSKDCAIAGPFEFPKSGKVPAIAQSTYSGHTTEILDGYACPLVLERGSSGNSSLTRPGEAAQVDPTNNEPINAQLVPVVT